MPDSRLRKTFSLIDTAGCGFIDSNAIAKIMAEMHGEAPPMSECRDIIAEIDTDGNDMVTFDEFVSLFKQVKHTNESAW